MIRSGHRRNYNDDRQCWSVNPLLFRVQVANWWQVSNSIRATWDVTLRVFSRAMNSAIVACYEPLFKISFRQKAELWWRFDGKAFRVYNIRNPGDFLITRLFYYDFEMRVGSKVHYVFNPLTTDEIKLSEILNEVIQRIWNYVIF